MHRTTTAAGPATAGHCVVTGQRVLPDGTTTSQAIGCGIYGGLYSVLHLTGRTNRVSSLITSLRQHGVVDDVVKYPHASIACHLDNRQLRAGSSHSREQLFKMLSRDHLWCYRCCYIALYYTLLRWEKGRALISAPCYRRVLFFAVVQRNEDESSKCVRGCVLDDRSSEV